MHSVHDVAIVGGGPAGLSAAIMLGRCRRRVIVIDSQNARNQAALLVNGFLGSDGVSPVELRKRGRDQACRYDVTFVNAEVTDVMPCGEGAFMLRVSNDSLVTVRKILFATGVKDEVPQIDGISEFYGTSVHHCPYCDGWEHRDQRLIALGDGDSMVELALSLLTWSSIVAACTNGKSLGAKHQQKLARAGVAYHYETIVKLDGEGGQLARMVFRNGPPLECDAIFFSGGQTQQSNLAEHLGCDCGSDGLMCHSDKQQSDVRGIFLAGDACSDTQFAIVAAALGAIAASAINEELHAEDLQAKEGKVRDHPENLTSIFT